MEVSYPKNSFSLGDNWPDGRASLPQFHLRPQEPSDSHRDELSYIFHEPDLGESVCLWPDARSLHHHDHFAFASTIEFAQEYALPPTKQQLTVFEGDGDA